MGSENSFDMYSIYMKNIRLWRLMDMRWDSHYKYVWMLSMSSYDCNLIISYHSVNRVTSNIE